MGPGLGWFGGAWVFCGAWFFCGKEGGVGVGLGGKEGDGDQATNESKDDEEVKEVKKVAKEVKDIQAMVKSFTSQPQELLSS